MLVVQNEDKKVHRLQLANLEFTRQERIFQGRKCVRGYNIASTIGVIDGKGVKKVSVASGKPV